MSKKSILIRDLYFETLKEITKDSTNWKRFLDTSSMNYKYLFSEAVLIFAQKPEAIACTDIETWNSKLNRWVNKGAKGIALLTNNNGNTVIRYVFDVTDTNNKFGKEFDLWSVDEKDTSDIIVMLQNKFAIENGEHNFLSTVIESTNNILDDNLNTDVLMNFSSNSESTLDVNQYKELIRDSIVYSIVKRSGLNFEEFNPISFENIKYISVNDVLVLGTIVNDISKSQLNEIRKTVKNITLYELKNIRTFEDRNINKYNDNTERGDNDVTIQDGRKLLDTDISEKESVGGNDNGEILTNEIELSERKQQSSLPKTFDERNIGRTSSGVRVGMSNENGNNDFSTYKDTEYKRNDEGNGFVEMESNDEPDQSVSDRGDTTRVDLHLNKEQPIIEKVEEASTFFVSYVVKEQIVLNSSTTENRKFRIYDEFRSNLSTTQIIKFLKNEYGIGGKSHVFENYSEFHDSKGITISELGTNNSLLLKWNEVVEITKLLINSDKWFDEKEKLDYQKYNNDIEVSIDDKGSEPTTKFIYKEKDKVYIDNKEYEIFEVGLFNICLLDKEFPLYNREINKNDFELKLKEFNFNKHLIIENTVDKEVCLINKIIEYYNLDNHVCYRGEYDDITMTDDNNLWYNDNLYEYLTEDVIDDESIYNCLTTEEYDMFDKYKESYVDENIIISPFDIDPVQFVDNEYIIKQTKFQVMSVQEDIVHLRNISLKNSLGFNAYEEMTLMDFCMELEFGGYAVQNLNIKNPIDSLPVKEIENDNHTKVNYKIIDDEINIAPPKIRFQNNIHAIKILKDCESNNRLATTSEQKELSKYVGWGGLSEAFDNLNGSWSNEYNVLKNLLTEEEYSKARESTLTAFYTPPYVIKSIYKAIENTGFTKGNILEPSCGVGNFMGMLPESLGNSNFYGVELDSVSGRIAQQLYQNNNIEIKGYENTSYQNNFFDVAISNVPFGDFKILDKDYDKHKLLIHDYFFAKSIDKVRPGGIVAFITSKGTMDKDNPSFRKYLSQRAELLGAIRLPDSTFKASAGTEVTSDIIFLQKRESIIEIDEDWIHLDTNEDGIKMNKYFIDNPEMILGDMEMVTTRFGMDSACKFYGNNLQILLDNAIQNIHAEITEYEIEELEEDISISADPTVKNFSYTIKDDTVFYRENSKMHKQDVSTITKERIIGLINIRDTTRELIQLQLNDYSNEDIEKVQKQLNDKYDIFTKKHGLINSRGNKTAFQNDDSYYLLCSLEILDENQNLKKKADIFSKRTIKANVSLDKVDTSNEALLLSLSEKGFIDLDFMSELCNKEVNVLMEELQGVIFKMPDDEIKYVTSDEYLSGNVREKLRIAKLYAAHDNIYDINVKKLEEVVPKDLEASEISLRLGATWIPSDYIKEFMDHLLTPSSFNSMQTKVTYFHTTANWNISNKNYDRGNVKANSSFGTHRVNAYKILEETLNLKDVRVYDYDIDDTGKKIQTLNKKETAIAQAKQEQIKNEFDEWIWSDPERRNTLVRMYNDKFNSIVNREFNGEHIIFHGMNPEINLRSHQKNAIARTLYGGNTLLAHEVGAGKTFTMVASAMESKRLGLCNKSLFVVPNHLVEQFSSEFLQLYPSANILVTTKRDFEKSNRKKFCSRISTGDYDAVIIAHSQFEKIPMSSERQIKMIEQQIETITNGIGDLKASNAERFSVKQLEKTKKMLQNKLIKLNDTTRKDEVVTFEELGVDRIYVDEAHYYKNLFLYTKMRNVGGIAQVEAQKSSDLFMKCKYLDELTGGKGVVFATGTPISNSMVELYTMQRYLQYNALVENKLEHFDSWASTFGETVTAIELSPEGSGYRAKTRFAKFYNLPELMSVFKEVADIQTAEMLKLPVPKANYHNVVVKPSETQKEMVMELSKRAEKVRNKMVQPNEDNMLKITNDGRKLALDQRLMNDLLPREFEGKVSTCANNVYDIWSKHSEEKLTQLIFCDMSTPSKDKFNVYDDMKNTLIEKGIPENEIDFIHNADTDIRKKELFSKVREGKVRVLMGSTSKMGAGTNVQEKLIALHDLDCPWRPSDLIQRSGRIIRQGNKNEEVEIFRYVTEGTFDAYLFQLVENKQKFISQIMTEKAPVRFADDIDETALSYGEIKALASGNPLILEKTSLDTDVAKLKLLKQSYLSQKHNLEDRIIKFYPSEINKYEILLRENKIDLVFMNSNKRNSDEKFHGMTLNNIFYNEKEIAGSKILEICSKKSDTKKVEIGEYNGFKLLLTFDVMKKQFELYLKNSLSYRVVLGDDAIGNITRIDNGLIAVDKQEYYKEKLEDLKNNLEIAKADVEKPFNKEHELNEKLTRLAEVDKLLNMGEKEEKDSNEKGQMYKNDESR